MHKTIVVACLCVKTHENSIKRRRDEEPKAVTRFSFKIRTKKKTLAGESADRAHKGEVTGDFYAYKKKRAKWTKN